MDVLYVRELVHQVRQLVLDVFAEDAKASKHDSVVNGRHRFKPPANSPSTRSVLRLTRPQRPAARCIHGAERFLLSGTMSGRLRGCGPFYSPSGLRSSSGSLAMFAAIRRAPSFASKFAACFTFHIGRVRSSH